MVTHVVGHNFSEGSRKVGLVVTIAVRSPVADVRFSYTEVAESLGGRTEASSGGVQFGVELGLMVVATHVVVVLARREAVRSAELVRVLGARIVNCGSPMRGRHNNRL